MQRPKQRVPWPISAFFAILRSQRGTSVRISLATISNLERTNSGQLGTLVKVSKVLPVTFTLTNGEWDFSWS